MADLEPPAEQAAPLAAVRVSRSGSETRQRSLVGRMRCTPLEYAQLEAAAERAGLTLGAFMRRQCLGTAGPRAARRPPAERAALAQLLAQLGKCGSNLNQIARALNSGGEAAGDIPAAIGDFRAACGDIMRALGKRPGGQDDGDGGDAAL